jgi:hypothetical protein
MTENLPTRWSRVLILKVRPEADCGRWAVKRSRDEELEVTVDAEAGSEGFKLRSAGLLRTARLLARGEVMVPAAVGSAWRNRAIAAGSRLR